MYTLHLETGQYQENKQDLEGKNGHRIVPISKNTKTFKRSIDGSSAVSIMKDFEFRGKKNKIMDNSSIKEVHTAIINNIKWIFKKKQIMDKLFHTLKILKINYTMQ